ncbi:MAG: hypothetical protein AAF804_02825 [Bacteroidota bacterium]
MEAISFAAFLVEKWSADSPLLSSQERADQLIKLIHHLTEELPAQEAAPYIQQVLTRWDEHQGLEALRRHPRWQDLLSQSLVRLEEALPVGEAVGELPLHNPLRRALEILANQPQTVEDLLQVESSLWLEGRFPLQTRIALPELRGLRSKYRSPLKPENEPAAVDGVPSELLVSSGVRLGELMKAFTQSKRDLLSFLIEEGKDFGINESEVPVVLLQLVHQYPSQIRITNELITWNARSWARILPLNGYAES